MSFFLRIKTLELDKPERKDSVSSETALLREIDDADVELAAPVIDDGRLSASALIDDEDDDASVSINGQPSPSR